MPRVERFSRGPRIARRTWFVPPPAIVPVTRPVPVVPVPVAVVTPVVAVVVVDASADRAGIVRVGRRTIVGRPVVGRVARRDVAIGRVGVEARVVRTACASCEQRTGCKGDRCLHGSLLETVGSLLTPNVPSQASSPGATLQGRSGNLASALSYGLGVKHRRRVAACDL